VPKRLGIMGIVLLLCCVEYAAAQAGAVVAIDLPAEGPYSAVADKLAANLKSRGVAVQAGAEPAVQPTCLVVSDDIAADQDKAQQVMDYVNGGGAVVLLFGRTSRHIRQANALLRPLGVIIEQVQGESKPLRFVQHPMTRGLASPTSLALRINITGPVRPLAFQGNAVVSAWLQAGRGGITIVPAKMVASISSERAGGPAVTYLVRACSWGPEQMARTLVTRKAPAGSRKQPPLPRIKLPEETVDFAGAILVDSRATDDHWAEIGARLVGELKLLGPAVKALAVEQEPDPLARALESGPALVVLGSWREFSEAEMMALEHYLWAGGRIFVAAGVGTRRQIRLVYLNTFLEPLGCIVTLRRPRGTLEVNPDIAAIAPQLTVPPGVQVLGNVMPLLVVKDHVAAGAMRYGEGTLVAMDVWPLWQVPEYRQVVGVCLKWLMQQPSGQ